MSNDCEIIYQHALMSTAAAKRENDVLMALTPKEREAKFASAVLVRKIEGAERKSVLEKMNLDHDIKLWLFQLAPGSKNVKMKVGDFSFSLIPEDKMSWRNKSIYDFKQSFPLSLGVIDGVTGEMNDDEVKKKEFLEKSTSIQNHLSVTIHGLDRNNLCIAVKPSPLLQSLVESRDFDIHFDEDHIGVIDPIHTDLFVNRNLKPALQFIGNPPSAQNKLSPAGILRIPQGTTKSTNSVPAEDFIWSADQTIRDFSRRKLENADIGIQKLKKSNLNKEQREGYESAITKRLTLLLGPPGTGKSATSIAIIAGILQDAVLRGEPIRIFISGPTWVAIDNLMEKIPGTLKSLGLEQTPVIRLRSTMSNQEDMTDQISKISAITSASDEKIKLAFPNLLKKTGSIIVGATPSQVAALRKITNENHVVNEIIDYLLIDEASQMDVAHAMTLFAALAPKASVTIVGDDKQMSPIQQVKPPKGNEFLVGSIYDFYTRYKNREGMPFIQLRENFRSNKEIVSISELADYEKLTSHNASMRVNLKSIITKEKPISVPAVLPWPDRMDEIMDPNYPLVALIHSDNLSSQQNQDEAKLVASMIASLRNNILKDSGVMMDDVELFQHGVGVVTPHRAQQAAVISALSEIGFKDKALEEMYRSVDTVERFQGQERSFMIASFGIGDADQISGEEEFLFNLNRFNVIVSRAKAKMVVLMSRNMANHLPHDYEALKGARMLRRYVDGTILTHRGKTNIDNSLGETEILLG